jgi:2-dehydro-3-deoxyglucarate aldolase
VSVSQRSNRYGAVKDYLQHINEQIAVIVQIESQDGLRAVREIAAVDGVDAVFVGPSDLAAAMGHLGNSAHPEVQAAIASVFAEVQAIGKPLGILAPVEADARRYMAMGASFVAVGSDLGVFRSGTQALIDRYRA